MADKKAALASVPQLTLVGSPSRETVAQQVRRLQGEARALAVGHVNELCQTLAGLEQLAGEIAEGGEAYPAGVREIARRLADECEARVRSIEAIVSRL